MQGKIEKQLLQNELYDVFENIDDFLDDIDEIEEQDSYIEDKNIDNYYM